MSQCLPTKSRTLCVRAALDRCAAATPCDLSILRSCPRGPPTARVDGGIDRLLLVGQARRAGLLDAFGLGRRKVVARLRGHGTACRLSCASLQRTWVRQSSLSGPSTARPCQSHGPMRSTTSRRNRPNSRAPSNAQCSRLRRPHLHGLAITLLRPIFRCCRCCVSSSRVFSTPQNRPPFRERGHRTAAHRVATDRIAVHRIRSIGASADGRRSVGALAIGAAAAGALAIGALAIGALAIRRLTIGKARMKHLDVQTLHNGRLVVDALELREPG